MLTVQIQTGNAAFDGNDLAECARILREAAKRLDNGDERGFLRDFNGNTVGRFWFEVTDDEA